MEMASVATASRVKTLPPGTRNGKARIARHRDGCKHDCNYRSPEEAALDRRHAIVESAANKRRHAAIERRCGERCGNAKPHSSDHGRCVRRLLSGLAFLFCRRGRISAPGGWLHLLGAGGKGRDA